MASISEPMGEAAQADNGKELLTVATIGHGSANRMDGWRRAERMTRSICSIVGAHRSGIFQADLIDRSIRHW